MNKTIEIIIEFVKAIKKEPSKGGFIEYPYKDRVCTITNTKYLLGQILRNYKIPESHYLISKSAKETWNAITDEPIENYEYQKKVECTKEINIEINRYVGNAKTPKKDDEAFIKKGSKFAYREVFHDEHMITISDIIDALINLEVLNEENVLAILDKIYICRVLKKEDRDLKPKNHRSLDLDTIIETVYKPHNVEVLKQ